jgi:hypothetical protein
MVRPWRSGIVAHQPSAASFETSSSLRGVSRPGATSRTRSYRGSAPCGDEAGEVRNGDVAAGADIEEAVTRISVSS